MKKTWGIEISPSDVRTQQRERERMKREAACPSDVDFDVDGRLVIAP